MTTLSEISFLLINSIFLGDKCKQTNPDCAVVLWLWFICVHRCFRNLEYFSVRVFVSAPPQVKYTTNPATMAKVISTCLREERRILSSACMQEQVCHVVLLQGEVPLVPELQLLLGNRCCFGESKAAPSSQTPSLLFQHRDKTKQKITQKTLIWKHLD